MKTVEYEFGSFRIFIKLKSSEKLESIVCKNDGERTMKLETGEVVKVTLSSEGCGSKVLRVKNLPSEVTDADLAKALQKYGSVGGIKWERYGPRSEFEGVLSGVRLVKMNLKVENVPSYVRVAGEEAYVKYSGQKETCRSCGRAGHIRKSCPGREERRNTYAGRLAGDNNPTTPGTNDVIMFDNIVGEGRDRKAEENSCDVSKSQGQDDEDGEEEFTIEEEEEKEEEEESERSSLQENMSAHYEKLASYIARSSATEIPRTDSNTSEASASSAVVEEGSPKVVSENNSEHVTLAAGVGAGEASTVETSTPGPFAEKKVKCLFDNNLLRDDPPPISSPVTATPLPHPLASFSLASASGSGTRPGSQHSAASSRPSTPTSQPSTPTKIPAYQPPAGNPAATRAAAKAAAIASEAAAKFAARTEEAKNSNKRALETSPGEGKDGGKNGKHRKGKNNKK